MIQAMTMSQKILAGHAGQDFVRPGSIVEARVDLVMVNDVSAPLVLKNFKEVGAGAVWDRDRVVLVADHFTPNKDLAAAQVARQMADFSDDHYLTHRFDAGASGVAHALLPEQGLTLPGELIVGGDSRTMTYGALGAFATGMGASDCTAAILTGRSWFRVPESVRVELTGRPNGWVGAHDLGMTLLSTLGPDGAHYQALEFCGPGAAALSMDARQTLCNLMVDTGAKAAMFEVDAVTRTYLEGRAKRPWQAVSADPEATYIDRLSLDLGQVTPLVAHPHSPHDVTPADRAGSEPLDQVFIGTCAGGRLEDLRVAAKVMAGKRVHRRVRLLVIPATPSVYRQALREGLLAVFLDAGGVLGPPSCGPCLGGHLGVLAAGEVALATANRNHPGRMGHPRSRVYLAGAAVAAASALAGRVAAPEETA